MMQILPFHSRQSQTNTDSHTLGENKLSWKIMSLHSWCPDSKHILSSCSLPHSLAAQLQTYLSAKFVSPAQPGLVLLGSLLLRHQRLFLLGTPDNKQTAWEGRRMELWDHPRVNRLSEQAYSRFLMGWIAPAKFSHQLKSPKNTHLEYRMQIVYWCYVPRSLTGDLLNLMDHHKGIRQSNLHWMIDRADLCNLHWYLK